MADSYETPPTLIQAEERLNKALDELTANVGAVKGIAGVADSFNEAANGVREVVGALRASSDSFENASKGFTEELKSLNNRLNEQIDGFTLKASEISQEVRKLSQKMFVLQGLGIAIIAALTFIAFTAR